MEFSAATIAGFLKGEIEGDPETVVHTIAKIEEGHQGALSFLANPKYEHFIYSTKSSIVLVNKNFVPSSKVEATLIRVENAYEAFASLLRLVDQSRPRKKGIHPTAVIEQTASVGKDVYIGPYSYIGENCIIGDNCSIYPQVYIGDNTKIGSGCTINPGVKIYHDCILGEGCIIHAGTVIGSDGFGFAPQSETEFMKIPQLGNVVIEDHVEIGANAAIDRATMGSTIIRKGVKLDNLIQIGHNVEVGENTVMAAQTGIAGSSKVGRNCMFAGQVGIAGHLTIADGTKLGAQAGVAGNIKNENSIFTGYPAIDHRNFLKSSVIFKNLPELKMKLDALEKTIESLKIK
ncbi:MAG TPA: UDP-3-O-(3-hydroxymyristoyl)glucosamine N-acyltransferase [Bacteroidales bacterium]|jgi:UDP-3-O-[3-hydroxymyristoyl] glucosamine N-acyltransferase|nr:UDP-3-O-(3-hydroxymyristoyl)glucosamine N-acyltransferase [Bacteroidales bacterium]OQB62311.1 MAG: UDP-3-O-acylglucosamine N-acyltransferase [Bacteroidetes bacterium ADurb.Bin145]NMD02813.1 UDP-3-O-(3-hydroxymyristoyl)glucosamine N-acyltransferase [Bacteroidales bacterium]HOU02535.1 UDP-3-O-(3-hydroxymyristoyl)glucosamine N-acyltransferase [Bacteroidales bacterium]HQG63844.1 UDP-3-O-(3-hydroxymyristoyl)glucosamine N-acyltransferase [Bacteroidales bacterium]